MRKSGINLSLVSLVLFIISCNNQKVVNEELEDNLFEFEEVIQLKGERVFSHELGSSVEIAGEFLLFELPSKDTSENVYNVYDIKSLEFLGSVGKRGQGPGDFFGAQFAGQVDYVDNDVSIWVNDAPQFRITSINLTQSLRLSKTVAERVIRHHPEHNFQSYLYVVDNRELVGYQPGYIPNTNLFPLHILRGGALSAGERNGKEELIHVGAYPEVENIGRIPNGRNFEKAFNSALVTMKADQSRFAVGFRQYDRLDIFDADGNMVESIRHPERYKNYNATDVYAPSLKWKIRNLMDFYRKVISTDKYIYTVYQNRNMGEFNDENGEGVDIRVFDWNGKLKFLLKCPDNIWTLAVDEKNGYIYANVDNEERFMRYDVKEVFSVR